jgi:hypothetical protein
VQRVGPHDGSGAEAAADAEGDDDAYGSVVAEDTGAVANLEYGPDATTAVDFPADDPDVAAKTTAARQIQRIGRGKIV